MILFHALQYFRRLQQELKYSQSENCINFTIYMIQLTGACRLPDEVIYKILTEYNVVSTVEVDSSIVEVDTSTNSDTSTVEVDTSTNSDFSDSCALFLLNKNLTMLHLKNSHYKCLKLNFMTSLSKYDRFLYSKSFYPYLEWVKEITLYSDKYFWVTNAIPFKKMKNCKKVTLVENIQQLRIFVALHNDLFEYTTIFATICENFEHKLDLKCVVKSCTCNLFPLLMKWAHRLNTIDLSILHLPYSWAPAEVEFIHDGNCPTFSDFMEANGPVNTPCALSIVYFTDASILPQINTLFPHLTALYIKFLNDTAEPFMDFKLFTNLKRLKYPFIHNCPKEMDFVECSQINLLNLNQLNIKHLEVTIYDFNHDKILLMVQYMRQNCDHYKLILLRSSLWLTCNIQEDTYHASVFKYEKEIMMLQLPNKVYREQSGLYLRLAKLIGTECEQFVARELNLRLANVNNQ